MIVTKLDSEMDVDQCEKELYCEYRNELKTYLQVDPTLNVRNKIDLFETKTIDISERRFTRRTEFSKSGFQLRTGLNDNDFGLNLFDIESNGNYIVETYNYLRKELIITWIKMSTRPKTNYIPLSAAEETNTKISNNTVQELIRTEEDYIKELQYALKSYQGHLEKTAPDHCEGIFCKLPQICNKAQTILELFKENSESTQNIASVFLESGSTFKVYLDYAKNTRNRDGHLKLAENAIQVKQDMLGDQEDLFSYLLKPIQRLEKYSQILRKMLKESIKSKEDLNLLQANSYIQEIMRKCDGMIAITFIKDCPIDLTTQGFLIQSDNFQCFNEDTEFCRLFLFEKVLVITNIYDEVEFRHLDYIRFSKFALRMVKGGPLELKLINSHTKRCYYFKAQSPQIKDSWMCLLKNKILEEIMDFEENVKCLPVDETKLLKTSSLTRAPLKAPRKRVTRSTSRFYV